MEIKTEIHINATPHQVWKTLTNFNEYPEWNPFIKSIEGEFKSGAKLKVRITPPGDNTGMVFKPTILTLQETREFRWLGHLLIPGIFDGEHYFILEESAGGTRFIHGEIFKGILVPFTKGMLAKTREGFELMNRAIKSKVEETAQ